jgi:hypothetical protein
LTAGFVLLSNKARGLGEALSRVSPFAAASSRNVLPGENEEEGPMFGKKLLLMSLVGGMVWSNPLALAVASRPIWFPPQRANDSGFGQPIPPKELALRMIRSRSYTGTWNMWAWNKEGYAVYCLFIITRIILGAKVGVQFSLRSPDGKVQRKMVEFGLKRLKGSRSKMDLKVDKHRLWGTAARWKLHVDFGPLGCDLTFVRRLKGFPYQGGMMKFKGKKFAGYTFAPSANVSGVLRLKGKKIAFRGKGMGERTWHDILLPDMSKRWYNARAIGQDYTVVASQLLTPKRWTPNSLPGLAIAYKGKWLFNTTHLTFRAYGKKKDRLSGYEVPQRTVYKTTSSRHPKVQVEIVQHKLYDRMDVFAPLNPVLRFLLQRLVAKPFIFRYRGETRLTLTTKKKTKKVTIPTLIEWAILNR